MLSTLLQITLQLQLRHSTITHDKSRCATAERPLKRNGDALTRTDSNVLDLVGVRVGHMGCGVWVLVFGYSFCTCFRTYVRFDELHAYKRKLQHVPPPLIISNIASLCEFDVYHITRASKTNVNSSMSDRINFVRT